MKQETNKRLEVGDKIFYHDGKTQWDIETVESINKAEKSVTLSNNVIISRQPKSDGTFEKLNGVTPNKDVQIRLATPELLKRRKAVLSRRLIQGYIINLQNGLLKNTELKSWERWSNSTQDKLISMAGRMAKGLEDMELDKDEEKALKKEIKNLK